MSRILIVDGDESIHDLIIEEMKCQKCDITKIIQAFNGLEGIEKYKKFRPKFVILNMRIPGAINGYQTFELIKKFDNNANVFLIVGCWLEDEMSDAIKSGVKGYISKNFEGYTKMLTNLVVIMSNIGE